MSDPIHTTTDAIDAALTRVQNALLQSQLPDGSWSEPVFGDARATAFYLIAQRVLEQPQSDICADMERWIAARQHPDGYWTGWDGGPADLELTAVCVLALEAAQSEPGARSGQRAAGWLDQQPTPKIDGFLQGLFAFNGELGWDEIPYVSPRLVSLPGWVHPNLYDVGVIRISMVATGVIQLAQELGLHQSSTRTAPAPATGWKARWLTAARRSNRGLILRANRLWRRFDRRTASRAAIDTAIDWLLDRQEEDGSFFSSVHMTMIVIGALRAVDPERFAPEIASGFDAMKAWQVRTAEGVEQCFTDATIWDTFLNAKALQAIGSGNTASALAGAKDFLMSKQIFHVGDYTRRTRGRPSGAWGFQRIGKHHPDVDDTALTLGVLLPMANDDPALRPKLAAAIDWLIEMQGSNGGWASWDRNDRGWISLLGGGRWFLRDTPCPVITARCAIILDRIARGDFAGFDALSTPARRAADRGFAFVERQRSGAMWSCRWFPSYLYGTSYGVICSAHQGLASEQSRDAVDWLCSVANPDGGFGETPESLTRDAFVAGPSTPFHTGSTLLALVKAGVADAPAAKAAAEWLLSAQSPDGRWHSTAFYASGLPGVWYIDFSTTPTYYAALGLAAYRAALNPASAEAGDNAAD